MDFSSIIEASHSVTKPPGVQTDSKNTPLATVEETIFAESIPTNHSGTSTSLSLPLSDKKRYKLFCAPEL